MAAAHDEDEAAAHDEDEAAAPCAEVVATSEVTAELLGSSPMSSAGVEAVRPRFFA